MDIEKSIRNAEASLLMENLRFSEEAKRDCILVLKGEMTDDEYMDRVRQRYAKFNNAGELYGEIQS